MTNLSDHNLKQTVASFEILFPLVKRGGYYIIEGTRCIWEENIADHVIRGQWPGMQYNTVQLRNRRSEITALLENLMRRLDSREPDLRFVHCYPNNYVIGK